jgi:hypothetical protein
MAKLAELAIGQEWASISPAVKENWRKPVKVTIASLEPYKSLNVYSWQKKFALKSDFSSKSGPTFIKVIVEGHSGPVEDYVLLGFLKMPWSQYEVEATKEEIWREKLRLEQKQRDEHNTTVVVPKRERLEKALKSKTGVDFHWKLRDLTEAQIDALLTVAEA